MAVVGRNRALRLAKKKFLADADGNTRDAASFHCRLRSDYFAVEAGDCLRALRRNVELHVRDSKVDRTEAPVRLMRANAIAPRANRIDPSIAPLEVKPRAAQPLAGAGKPLLQRIQVRNNQTDDSPQDLGIAARQMELCAP